MEDAANYRWESEERWNLIDLGWATLLCDLGNLQSGLKKESGLSLEVELGLETVS